MGYDTTRDILRGFKSHQLRILCANNAELDEAMLLLRRHGVPYGVTASRHLAGSSMLGDMFDCNCPVDLFYDHGIEFSRCRSSDDPSVLPWPRVREIFLKGASYMVSVTVGDERVRRTYAVYAHRTVASFLTELGIDCAHCKIFLDGTELFPADLVRTFADHKITHRCFLYYVQEPGEEVPT